MQSNRRITLMLAALALIVLVVLGPAWAGFMKDYRRAQAHAGQARLRLVQARDLRDRIVAERTAGQALEKIVQARERNFDLYSYVNSRINAQGAGTYSKLTSKGSTSTGRRMQIVDIELKGIRQKTLLSLIHNVYKGRNLIVLQRLHYLRPARTGTGIDCKMTFTSPRS